MSCIHSSIFGITMNLLSFGLITIHELELSNSNLMHSFVLLVEIV